MAVELSHLLSSLTSLLLCDAAPVTVSWRFARRRSVAAGPRHLAGRARTGWLVSTRSP